MKSNIVVYILVISLLGSCSPKSEKDSTEVPAVVKESFNKLFPNATNIKWSKENDSEYEAEFSMGALNKSSNFDQTGKWLVTETEINVAGLPAAVQSTISNEFTSYSIEEVEAVESADGSSFYEVELESGDTNLEVQFSSEGKVLKKEAIEEEEEKD